MTRARIGVAITALCALAASFTPALASSGRQPSAVEFAKAEIAYYAHGSTEPASGVDTSCFSADDNSVDPGANSAGHPTNPQWLERDALNQYCATLRLRDQYTNPAYGYELAENGDALWIAQLGEQISDGPGHVHGGITTLVPGSQAADSFRTVSAWESATGGHAIQVAFASSDGAQLRGHLWLPPAGAPTLADGHYPGVVITDGSIQGYENLYYWAAEGLAQYGYEVMTYDVQGQGDSDLLPAKCPNPSQPTAGCTGVPYQQNYNFFQGAEDSLGYFLSTPSHPYNGTYNPGWSTLDGTDVGVAGHSLGAEAVSWVGQCDKRVRAIVAWDDLVPVDMSKCAGNVSVAKGDLAQTVHAPALAMTNDYEFNPQPQSTVPNPNGSANGGGLDGTAGYLSLARQGVDAQVVSIRNGTHLTYSYVPYVLPSNELGERIAFYYTLAWFDEYLRGGRDPLLPATDSAYSRLTSLGSYDQSADHDDNSANPGAARISFGAGTYSATQAATDPTDPAGGNVPYEIQGISIPDTLSFYYYSEYRIHDPNRSGDPWQTCNDMLARCPATQPPTP